MASILPPPDDALLDINDISSVHILRGPQDTLFGKNTTGGVVVFTTTLPSDEFESSVSITTGSFNERNLSAMVNVPLSDSWTSRFSFVSKLRDGFIENDFLNVDTVNEDRQAAMLKLRYMAEENFTADINFDYSKVESTPRPSKCQVVSGSTGWLAELLDAIVITPSTGRKFVDFCQDSSLAVGGDTRSVLSDLDGKYLAEVMGTSLQFDWALYENLHLITGLRYTQEKRDFRLGIYVPDESTLNAAEGGMNPT
jgi:iron complex outermembrane receptor protein